MSDTRRSFLALSGLAIVTASTAVGLLLRPRSARAAAQELLPVPGPVPVPHPPLPVAEIIIAADGRVRIANDDACLGPYSDVPERPIPDGEQAMLRAQVRQIQQIQLKHSDELAQLGRSVQQEFHTPDRRTSRRRDAEPAWPRFVSTAREGWVLVPATTPIPGNNPWDGGVMHLHGPVLVRQSSHRLDFDHMTPAAIAAYHEREASVTGGMLQGCAVQRYGAGAHRVYTWNFTVVDTTRGIKLCV